MSSRIVAGWIDWSVETAVSLGALLDGDMVVAAGAFVNVAFDGTTPTLDIGVTANDDAYATDIVISALGHIAPDELTAVTNLRIAAGGATQLVGKFVSAGGTPSAGRAYVWAQVLNDNPDNS